MVRRSALTFTLDIAQLVPGFTVTCSVVEESETRLRVYY